MGACRCVDAEACDPIIPGSKSKLRHVVHMSPSLHALTVYLSIFHDERCELASPPDAVPCFVFLLVYQMWEYFFFFCKHSGIRVCHALTLRKTKFLFPRYSISSHLAIVADSESHTTSTTKPKHRSPSASRMLHLRSRVRVCGLPFLQD